MDKKFIIANWKMNPNNTIEGLNLFNSIKKVVFKNKNLNVVICAPFVYLQSLKKIKKVSNYFLGAQNVGPDINGAYTGEISASMLKDSGVAYSIIGHSERREMGENDILINQKIKLLLKYKIIPILCIGEKERDKDYNYFSFIQSQINETLVNLNKNQIKNIIIAYEPVWAIGKNSQREITNEELNKMVIFIRKTLADITDMKTAHIVKIIYGGSVNKENAYNLLEYGGVDGLLVGGESLSIKNFSKLLERVNKI